MNGTKAVFAALALAVVLKFFVFDFMIAQGHSMEPVIHDGTILVISRLRYGFRFPWQQKYMVRFSEPKTGDVVVFYTPQGESAGVLAVKRIVELTGEGKFLAKGDNELASYDSRSYGPVPFNNIIGKVLFLMDNK